MLRVILPFSAVAIFSLAPDADAVRRRIPCGQHVEKTFRAPRPLAFRIANTGDCAADVHLQDTEGRFAVNERLNPGDVTRWLGPSDVLMTTANVFVDPGAGLGALLLVESFAGPTTHDLGACDLLGSAVIYHQFFTCPPTAAPGITVTNTGECDLRVVGTQATGEDWSGEVDVPLHDVPPGGSTPVMADTVRRYKVLCLAAPASGRCRFRVTN